MYQIRQKSTDTIKRRLVVNGEAQTITVATAQILSPGGSELRADSGVGISGTGTTQISLSITWDDDTYTKQAGYRVVWTFTVGSDTYTRDSYFSIVSRVFESELIDQDIYDEHPLLEDEVSSSGLKVFRNAAWTEILMQIRARFQDIELIGGIFNPEVFKRAHLYGTLYRWYMQNAHTTVAGSEDWEKMKYFERQFIEAMDLAFQQIAVDDDDDDKMSQDKEKPVMMPAVRWGR